MMVLVTSLSFGLTAVLCLALGGRLLWLSRRTRGAPEFFWGLAWFLGATENTFAALSVAVSNDAVRLAMRWGVAIVYPAVVMTILVACWRLFRPDRLWPKVVCALAGASLLVIFVIETAVIGLDAPLLSTDLSLLGFANDVGMTLGFSWAAVETWLHYRTFEKRARIGLAPRFLSFRYLLWFYASSVLLLYWLMLWSRYVIATPRWFLDASLPFLMLGSVLLMWLTFFPPRSWRQRFASTGTTP